MMHPRRLMAWLTVAALSTTLVAAPKRSPPSTKASSEEPFRSFRMLDAKLTLLTNQQDGLKAAFYPVQAGSRSMAARRTTASRSMNSTAAGIGRIAGGLERLYQKRHQPFGVQMFRVLRVRAEDVQRGVNAVAEAKTPSAVDLPQRGWMNGLCPSLFSSKLRRADMERPVAPPAHGPAANQSGPKTYSKVNGSHASGGVFQRLGPVPGSSVRVSGGPEVRGKPCRLFLSPFIASRGSICGRMSTTFIVAYAPRSRAKLRRGR